MDCVDETVLIHDWSHLVQTVHVATVHTSQAYWPAKWRFGIAHPHRVVESASLASVQPPDVTYKLRINDVIAAGALSIVQVRYWSSALWHNNQYASQQTRTHINTTGTHISQTEAIVYACQRFEHHLGNDPTAPRAGFFLGDGAGVGKGRTIAGLLLEQWRRGRTKAVWVSTSSDLVNDARRYAC